MNTNFIINEIKELQILLNRIQLKNKINDDLIFLESENEQDIDEKLKTLCKYSELIVDIQESIKRSIKYLYCTFDWEKKNTTLKEIILSGYIREIITDIKDNDNNFEFKTFKNIIGGCLNLNMFYSMDKTMVNLSNGEIYEIKLKRYRKILLKGVFLGFETKTYKHVTCNSIVKFHVSHLFKNTLIGRGKTLKVDEFKLKGLKKLHLNEIETIKLCRF